MHDKKFILDHNKIIVVLSAMYALLAPLIPFVKENAFWCTLAFFIIIAAIAAFYKAKVDLLIALILAVGFGLVRLKFNKVTDDVFVFRAAAISAFVFLHITMLIGPWARFTKIIQRFYKHRRHLGVTTFFLGLLHASFILNTYFRYSLKDAWAASFVFFGFTALFILSLLAITSWDYLQKHVQNKWWKIIHTLTFFIYLGCVLYFRSVVIDELSLWQIVFLISFLIFWLLVAPWSLPRRILTVVNGWKQLHVLIYIAYVSVISHVWSGVVKNQDSWLQIVFWTLVLIVAASHAVGWLMMLKQWLVRRKQTFQSILLNGKKYYKLGSIHSFQSEKGKRMDVAGVSLAVFLHEGKVIAFSNICPHQKGPIADGEIVNGYVECPWHNYQFSVNDGSGPPGFRDCIPYFPVIMQDDDVYVCLEPIKPVTVFP